jgi:hypothetical protein
LKFQHINQCRNLFCEKKFYEIHIINQPHTFYFSWYHCTRDWNSFPPQGRGIFGFVCFVFYLFFLKKEVWTKAHPRKSCFFDVFSCLAIVNRQASCACRSSVPVLWALYVSFIFGGKNLFFTELVYIYVRKRGESILTSLYGRKTRKGLLFDNMANQ